MSQVYIPFREQIAQGSFRIIGAQRVDADASGDLSHALSAFANSQLAQECAAVLENAPSEAQRCWLSQYDGYVLEKSNGWIVSG